MFEPLEPHRGQVRNLNRMLEEDRCRIDDATQIAAVRAAQRPMEEAILHAQEIGPPSARTVAIVGAVQCMKAELRNHAYDGDAFIARRDCLNNIAIDHFPVT